MQGIDKSKTIDVIGGTYRELCLEPEWDNYFGSGLRAALTIKGIDSDCHVSLHTIADKRLQLHLRMHYGVINLDIKSGPYGEPPITFYYQNPLKQPVFYNKKDHYPPINVKTDNCVLFGMMETTPIVDAHYIVYDPQSPEAPIPFSESGSKAEHLCIVLNEREAQKWSGKETDIGIRDSLFASEHCDCLIIKKGAKGALLFDCPKSDGIVIPIFQTDNVWTLGSGDVFTASFGYYWAIARESPENSAKKASLAVACYSNSKSLERLDEQIKNANFTEYIPKESGRVYLAGPFFTMAERLFVNECREALMSVGLSVFSPFHDVGLGTPDDVVPKDIEAINNCKTIFAILDGMDSGTVFEVGYGVALGKRIVILAENETQSHLQMMKGTNCFIEKDFVTAIYRTSWLTNE